MSQQHDVILS